MSQTSLNYKAIIRLLGSILLIIGISMTIPWIYAEFTSDTAAVYGFRKCTIPTMLAGLLILIFIKRGSARFRVRDGYIIAALCWVMSSLVGALPYFFSDFTGNFIDALFESTSGFTTTGATAVAEFSLPKSLLLWKALTHWLGGMGIMVFVISLLPALGINGQMIAKAESPGPVLEKMAVRMSDSAKILYMTYLTFTVSEFILLMLSGKMSIFDAAVNTMGSISTGGLLVHPEGIAFYDSFYIEAVISIFCILSSINFVLYHYLLTKKYDMIKNDIELKFYLIVIAISILICTASLALHTDSDWSTSFRDAFFQVISMATTSGYTRSPYTIWPSTCQIMLITLMFMGGCAASTSGSIKVIRVLVMFKLILRGCIKRMHPRSVVAVKLNGNAIPAPIVFQITTFIMVYMAVFLISMFIVSFQGLDIESTFTSVLAMLSNTGAAFGEAGVMGNYSMFNPFIKVFFSALMIVGRLELFTIIVMFSRNFWGRDR